MPSGLHLSHLIHFAYKNLFFFPCGNILHLMHHVELIQSRYLNCICHTLSLYLLNDTPCYDLYLFWSSEHLWPSAGFYVFCDVESMDISSKANPMTFVAIVPKIVVKNLFFLLLKLGSINPISCFAKYCRLSSCNSLSVVDKTLHRGQFFCNALCTLIGNFS